MLSAFIIQVLDWIYPLFRRFMPRQTFFYAACGGGNTLLSLIVFFVGYNFIFRKQMVSTPLVTISPHIAAMILSFAITFPLGFYMARNVVFSGSPLRRRYQLFRYMVSTGVSLVLNYINLKILVDWLKIYPTISQIINTVIVVAVSYLMQKHFAFRQHHAPA